ncbi:MAG: hypothetical protein H0U52_13395 [Chloroflexi bacterium]|nr:hypothetical protein [Chloroflexota bacterium]
MRRLTVLSLLFAALTFGVAAPVAATDSSARIVSIVPGFRQNLVDIVGITYDRVSQTTRLTVTVHCFHGYYQIAPDELIDLGESELELDQLATAVQGGVDVAMTSMEATELTTCDTQIVFTFVGLKVGIATFTTSISQGVFSGHVTTTTTIRAIQPSR